ncbi:Cilia and flagella-associated protein 70, partial [Taenia solium]
SDKEVVLCSISEAIKIEKLAINDGCMSESGGNLRHREETASENKVELSNSSYLLKWDKEWRQLTVTRVRGAYEVKRFVDKLFEQKDTKGPSIAPDVVDMLRASNPSAKKDKAASTSKKETAKSSTADNISLEGINFDQHNASISVDIQLSKPLVPRRKEESAVLDVKDVLKRLEPAPTEPINTLNNFLGDLKVHLMQEGRQLLRCVVEGEYEPRNMPSIGGLTQSDLRYFAEEAEVLGNLSWANFFIQNMLAEKPKSKEALIAASSFYARVGNREEAVVCLKWCLEITPNDVEVWWSLGTLLAEMGKFDEAKRLLEAAYEIASSDPTLWIVLAKLDDQRDEGVMSEYTDCMNLINTIDRLLELKASTFVDRALARLLLHIKRYRCTLGDTKAENDFKLPDWIARSSKIYRDYMHDLSAYHRLLARHIMQSSDGTKRLLQAETHLKAALQAQPECADNWACLGSLYYLQMDKKRSIECLERAMQLETWPIQKPRLIQVQLAQCYAEIEDFEKSKLQYLQCCHQHPTSESWKGVGVACFRLNGLEEAEVAFQEANRLNNRDPVVWAYLAMLCLKANKRSQAELCIQSVQMLGLTDESIRKELDQVISNTESLSNDEN